MKSSVELVESMTEAEVENLMSRLKLVQSWVDEFGRAVSVHKTPRVRIAHSCVHYGPISHTVGVPAHHLVTLDLVNLRLVVAHEFGHSLRRWPSLFSWTTFARMKEEVRADRAAIRLTGASIDAWETAVRAVMQIEHTDEIGSPDDALNELTLRRKCLEVSRL